MLAERLRIMVATSSYWLVGNYDLMGLRTQDALNDDRTDFVRLTDVHLFGQPDEECLAKLADILLPKQQIEFVVLLASHHEAPEKRWNNFVPKHTASTWMLLGEFFIQGHMQLSDVTPHATEMLFKELSDFFAIIGATVRRPGSACCEAPVLLANKKLVRGFHVEQEDDELSRLTAELQDEDSAICPFELIELLVDSDAWTAEKHDDTDSERERKNLSHA